jgi:hypothetical protein
MGKGVIHSLVSASSAITQLIEIPAQKQTPNIVLISYSCQIAKMVIWQFGKIMKRKFNAFPALQKTISFGADRIYDVLSWLNLFPESFTHSADCTSSTSVSGGRQITCCELYSGAAKMKKQLPYATATIFPLW